MLSAREFDQLDAALTAMGGYVSGEIAYVPLQSVRNLIYRFSKKYVAEPEKEVK